MAAKYDHINFKPPEAVANAAARGLEYRAKQGEDKAGLTPSEASKQGIGSGVQRASNLKNRSNVSPKVVRQMAAFFSRHEKNKAVAAEHKGEPWKDKGHVAWLLWGGDPGRAWAEKVVKQMDAADEKEAKKTASRVAGRHLAEQNGCCHHRGAAMLISQRVADRFKGAASTKTQRVAARYSDDALLVKGF